MKLIPFLLYVVAVGLFGLAGWTVYQMLPMWKAEVRTEATTRGQTEARASLLKGRAQGQRSTAWVYSEDAKPWWAAFAKVNLIGKPPPPPPGRPTEPEVVVAPPVEVRPLEQMIELVSLVYDGSAGGKGGNTHVIVRFKQDANVEPPEWWQKENPPGGLAAAAPRPRDGVPANQPSNRGGQPQRPPAGRPPTPMPASSAGREVLQRLWVDDGGDPRRSATLWPVKAADGRPMGAIKLVAVSDDATEATFAREVPAAKPGDPPETRLEPLIKTNVNLAQAVLRVTRELQGRPVEPAAGSASSSTSAPAAVEWFDVEETTQRGNVFNIGTNDERTFAQNPDRFIDQLNFGTYVNKDKAARGLILKGVPAEVGSRFGLKAGDVLIDINGRPVKSRADAYSNVKSDYERGVRTFHTRWMINGQIVEKTYQAPTKKK
jgi:hypothetical protein